MTAAVFAFPEWPEPAEALAGELGVPCHRVGLHRFPDGESLIRIPEECETALLYRSLDDPNAKLVELVLAASALRDRGARKVVLVAPYLAYMRQDMAFHPGEAVSQRVIGRLIAEHFDGIATIDPHLHRISHLDEAMPGIPALSLSAASVLAEAVGYTDNPVLVGPDSESRQWVDAVAAPAGLDVLLGEKVRHGDRDVEIVIPGIETVRGRAAMLVDDVISSGATLARAAALLRDAGASRIEALATHCLAGPDDLTRLKSAGIVRVRSCETVKGPTASLRVSALVAGGLRRKFGLG